jgi:hypothetical protein
MATAEARQAMAVIAAVLRASTPEVPEGQAPLTVPGWRELRDAWSAYYQLQRYFGMTDPPPPADDAPGDIDPHDPSRVNKWVYSEDESGVLFPNLRRTPEDAR